MSRPSAMIVTHEWLAETPLNINRETLMKINPTLNPEIFDIFINYADYFCVFHSKPSDVESFETTFTPSKINNAAIEFSKLSGRYVKSKALVGYYEFVNKIEKDPESRNRYREAPKRNAYKI